MHRLFWIINCWMKKVDQKLIFNGLYTSKLKKVKTRENCSREIKMTKVKLKATKSPVQYFIWLDIWSNCNSTQFRKTNNSNLVAGFVKSRQNLAGNFLQIKKNRLLIWSCAKVTFQTKKNNCRQLTKGREIFWCECDCFKIPEKKGCRCINPVF